MNTLQVRKYLQSLVPTVHHVGVYAADLLPTPVQPSTALIVNLDPHTERGSHWVAFYMAPEGRHLEYFDSYGRPPHLALFQSFLRKNRLPYAYNHHALQGLDTSICAHYCLGFLYCRSLGLTLQDFVQLFGDSAAQNDVLMYNLFTLMYRN